MGCALLKRHFLQRREPPKLLLLVRQPGLVVPTKRDCRTRRGSPQDRTSPRTEAAPQPTLILVLDLKFIYAKGFIVFFLLEFGQKLPHLQKISSGQHPSRRNLLLNLKFLLWDI